MFHFTAAQNVEHLKEEVREDIEQIVYSVVRSHDKHGRTAIDIYWTKQKGERVLHIHGHVYFNDKKTTKAQLRKEIIDAIHEYRDEDNHVTPDTKVVWKVKKHKHH